MEERGCNVDIMWRNVEVMWRNVDVMRSNVDVIWTIHISKFHQVLCPPRTVILKYANVNPPHLRISEFYQVLSPPKREVSYLKKSYAFAKSLGLKTSTLDKGITL